MAKEKVEIQYSLKDKASKGLKVLSGRVLGVVAGLSALSAGIAKSVKLYAKQEAAVTSLNTALENNNDYTEDNTRALQDHASALQRVTTFGDEQIISAQAHLAQMGLTTEQIMQATEATLDFAAAQGTDLDAAAKLVGKSIGTSTNALGRYGIQIDSAADQSEKLDAVVAGLGERFGGQARAQALTFQGSIQQMENAMGDVGEVVGSLFAPMLQKGAQWVTNLAMTVADFAQTDTFAKFVIRMQKLLAELGAAFGRARDMAAKLFSFFIESNLAPVLTILMRLNGLGVLTNVFTASVDEQIAKVDEKIAKLEEKRDKMLAKEEEMSERDAEKFEELMEQLAEQEQRKNELIAEKEKERAEVQEFQRRQAAVRQETANRQMLAADKARIEAQKKLDEERAKNFDSTLGFMAQGMSSKSKEIFEIGKAASISQAIMNTGEAVTKALASAPPPFNFIMAGATLAVGMDNVSRIQSTQFQAQEGAIVEPTAGGSSVTVGEAGGAEAIIPLDEGEDALGGSGLGSPAITVMIDGREMAREFYEINTDQIRNGEIQQR